jgi:RimJ/RimL family protein N-acetyltransferase
MWSTETDATTLDRNALAGSHPGDGWRPLTADDRPQVEALLEGLSERSRTMRFASPMPVVDPRVVRHLCAVDGDRHVAWGAFASGRLVAMGRYVRFTRDPGCADVAFTVADEAQGRGLGTAMMVALARAAMRAGVDRLSFTALGDNRPAQRLLARFGVTLRFSAGLGEATVPVAEVLKRCAAWSEPDLPRAA